MLVGVTRAWVLGLALLFALGGCPTPSSNNSASESGCDNTQEPLRSGDDMAASTKDLLDFPDDTSIVVYHYDGQAHRPLTIKEKRALTRLVREENAKTYNKERLVSDTSPFYFELNGVRWSFYNDSVYSSVTGRRVRYGIEGIELLAESEGGDTAFPLRLSLEELVAWADGAE